MTRDRSDMTQHSVSVNVRHTLKLRPPEYFLLHMQSGRAFQCQQIEYNVHNGMAERTAVCSGPWIRKDGSDTGRVTHQRIGVGGVIGDVLKGYGVFDHPANPQAHHQRDMPVWRRGRTN